MPVVGVVGYQGGVEEHIQLTRAACGKLGFSCDTVVVKRPHQLKGVDAVIIPGGESTTIAKLMERMGLMEPLREAILSGLPALGTCAGAIIMAKEVRDRVVGVTGQPVLGVMDVEVVRNYFGRQRESFELDLEVEHPLIGRRVIRGVFIRAPAIVRVWADAKPMATLKLKGGEVIAAAYERNMIATIFHPELTSNTSIHEILVSLAKR